MCPHFFPSPCSPSLCRRVFPPFHQPNARCDYQCGDPVFFRSPLTSFLALGRCPPPRFLPPCSSELPAVARPARFACMAIVLQLSDFSLFFSAYSNLAFLSRSVPCSPLHRRSIPFPPYNLLHKPCVIPCAFPSFPLGSLVLRRVLHVGTPPIHSTQARGWTNLRPVFLPSSSFIFLRPAFPSRFFLSTFQMGLSSLPCNTFGQVNDCNPRVFSPPF